MFPPLTHTELSSIFGYQSICCWVIVYSPQIWENFVLKSGDGLSVPFILLWLGGDLTNLIGGAMANVLPTMIILAVYYTICDFVLLYQVYYYRYLRRKAVENPESQPLLLEAPTEIVPILPAYLSYPLLLTLVAVTGVAAWSFSDHHPTGNDGPAGDVELEWKSQVLGYASCFLYIGSRIPQVFHNVKTRCEGLSLAMFFFSIMGNVTYIASILFTSLEHRYLVANASWIAGAGLTIFLDLFILGQFFVYSYQDRNQKVFAADNDDVNA
jgi:hypothetical protein